MQTWAMSSSRIKHGGYPKLGKHQSDNAPPGLSSRCFFASGMGPVALPSQDKFHVHRFVLGSVVPCGEKLIRPRHRNLVSRFTTFYLICCNHHECFYLPDSCLQPGVTQEDLSAVHALSSTYSHNGQTVRSLESTREQAPPSSLHFRATCSKQ